MINQDAMKKAAAESALQFVKDNMTVGIGTGSTVNYFIDALASIKHRIEGAVPSSQQTADRLKKMGIPLVDLNSVSNLPLYVDGCDEFNRFLELVKGGGGALTREKIVATASKEFICIADQSKKVDILGKFPIAVEVIPLARSYVARQIVKLGGDPNYREGFVTDNGNVILDVFNLNILEPIELEDSLNKITGVVENGIFGRRNADKILLGTSDGVITITSA